MSSRAYREANRGKIRDWQRAHYAANREKVIANRKKYYEDEDNREKVKAYQRDYRRAYYAANRDYVKRSLMANGVRRSRIPAPMHGKPWTDPEDHLVLSDRPLMHIAVELGRSYRSIAARRYKLRSTTERN